MIAAPVPAELTHLRPRNLRAAVHVLSCSIGTAGSLYLSSRQEWWAWLAGQVLLAVFFVQWFVLLHECGHGVLFRRKRVNTLVGHLSSLFCGIPYHSWTAVHGAHHKWTGWQDRDPTTAGLVPRPLGRVEKAALDFCWRFWVPLFTVGYRITNFWHLYKLRRLFPKNRRARLINVIALAGAYIAIVAIVGPLAYLRLIGLALLLSMIFLDPLMLSQHTHVPMKLSGGEPVSPHPSREQLPYTRSLRFPRWFASAVLLNFDAHELHHMYPQVPGYDLRRIDFKTPNEVVWWRWIWIARRTPAHVLLFQNRDKSGLKV